MFDYDKKVEKNIKRNAEFIVGFEAWLREKDLAEKTIRKHLNNTDLYINDYLNYYDITKAEDGIDEVYSFLNGWFIEKCLWASKTSIKETAASIMKFYQYMSENNYVTVEDYRDIRNFIRENMDEILETLEEYENEIYDDFY